MNSKTKFGITALVLFLVVIASTIFLYKYSINIEKPYPAKIEKNQSTKKEEQKPVVYFGVISRYTPNIIYKGYQPLMDYLTENSKYHFELKLSKNYEETVTQLVNNEVSAAFLGTFIYLKERKRSSLTAILKPLNDSGKPYFHSALVAKMGSSISSINELKGKRLALPSKQSFSGNWLPLNKINEFDINIEHMDTVHHFSHHHTVVHQILMGNFDAGVVKDRVAAEFLNKGIKIIALSDPIPGSPIVIPKDFNPDIVEAIKQALLKVDVNDPYFKNIVKNWDKEFSNGFVEASSSDYDMIEKKILLSEGFN